MTTELQEAPQETEAPQSITVSLAQNEWVAVTQLLSVGVRQSDDTVLELGGRLLRQIKQQLTEPSE